MIKRKDAKAQRCKDWACDCNGLNNTQALNEIKHRDTRSHREKLYLLVVLLLSLHLCAFAPLRLISLQLRILHKTSLCCCAYVFNFFTSEQIKVRATNEFPSFAPIANLSGG